MIGWKRFTRPGFVVSATAHFGVVVLGLLVAGANSSQPAPPKAILTDAMLVDVVPPNEVPRLEGKPADAATSGSQSPLNTNTPNAAAQPPPKPAPPPRQQPQPRSNPPPEAHQSLALPLTAQSDTALPQKEQSETPQPKAEEQTSEPETSPPQPQRFTHTPDHESAETFARFALMGGQLGGGFEAPAVDAAKAAHDFTVAFRERVSSCSVMPPGVVATDKIAVALKVSFNPDGTLASSPELRGPVVSQKEDALMHSAVEALQRCQPYTMLPPDKYKQWKTLELIFAPINFFAR
jgi:hypothetical protein